MSSNALPASTPSSSSRVRAPGNETMSAMQYAGATRFRLRFLLQEFELPPGDTLIGRSNDCHITLFDPLISRKHARIQVLGNQAILEDLGSRNGCRVNGAPLRGRHPLSSGDRIRVG